MSYLLEILGRGLLANLQSAFRHGLSLEPRDLAEVQRLADEDPADQSQQLQLGFALLVAGQVYRARQTFAGLLAIDPEHVQALLGMACALDEAGKNAEAIEFLQAALEAVPQDPACWFALGYSHERLGHEESAIEAYRESLKHCARLRNAHERLAAIYLKRNQLELAIAHYEQLCWCDPAQIDNQLVLANLLLETNAFEEAIRRYQFALTIDPENWDAKNDIVAAYAKAGMIREAIGHLSKVIDEQPGFADNHVRLGDLYAELGDDARAIDAYREAARLNPDYLEAAIKNGTAYLRTGDYKQAAEWFSRAVEINDRILTAYVGLGIAQKQSGAAEEASEAFEMAASIEPNSTLLFSEMAKLQLKVAACESVDRFTERSNSSFMADPQRVPEEDLLHTQVQRYREALELHPNHADLHYHLGVLLRHADDVEGAIGEFKKALEINPAYVKALVKLGLALKQTHRLDEAVEVLRQAVEIKPDYVDLHYQLGLIFAQRQRFELAVEQFEAAAKGNPNNPDFLANLALCLQNMGLLDRAAACLQTVDHIARQADLQSAVV